MAEITTLRYGKSALQLMALVLLFAVSFVATISVFAAHEGDNSLKFVSVANSPSPNASGQGTINLIKWGPQQEPNTKWTSSFQFSGLQPNTKYTVAVQGRFADANAFSGICTFTTGSQGSGSCRNYFTGLQRLAVAQLRLGGEGGKAVLEANRAAGNIVSGGGGSWGGGSWGGSR